MGASQVALVVKNLPANAGDIRDVGSSPGWARSLEEGTATYCHILAWRIPRTEEPGELQSTGSQRVGCDWNDLAQDSTWLCNFRSPQPNFAVIQQTLRVKICGINNSILHCKYSDLGFRLYLSHWGFRLGFPGGSDGKESACKVRVSSLSKEDTLEKGMATHSSILAWKFSWSRGAWGATIHGVAKS